MKFEKGKYYEVDYIACDENENEGRHHFIALYHSRKKLMIIANFGEIKKGFKEGEMTKFYLGRTQDSVAVNTFNNIHEVSARIKEIQKQNWVIKEGEIYKSKYKNSKEDVLFCKIISVNEKIGEQYDCNIEILYVINPDICPYSEGSKVNNWITLEKDEFITQEEYERQLQEIKSSYPVKVGQIWECKWESMDGYTKHVFIEINSVNKKKLNQSYYNVDCTYSHVVRHDNAIKGQNATFDIHPKGEQFTLLTQEEYEKRLKELEEGKVKKGDWVKLSKNRLKRVVGYQTRVNSDERTGLITLSNIDDFNDHDVYIKESSIIYTAPHQLQKVTEQEALKILTGKNYVLLPEGSGLYPENEMQDYRDQIEDLEKTIKTLEGCNVLFKDNAEEYSEKYFTSKREYEELLKRHQAFESYHTDVCLKNSSKVKGLKSKIKRLEQVCMERKDAMDKSYVENEKLQEENKQLRKALVFHGVWPSEDVTPVGQYKEAIKKAMVNNKERALTVRDVLIQFMDSIRDYVAESKTNIAHDERESYEFVDIYLNQIISEQHKFESGEIDKLKGEVTRLSKLSYDRRHDRERLQEENEKLQENIKSLQQNAADWINRYDLRMKQINSLESELSELKGALQVKDDHVAACRKRTEALKAENESLRWLKQGQKFFTETLIHTFVSTQYQEDHVLDIIYQTGSYYGENPTEEQVNEVLSRWKSNFKSLINGNKLVLTEEQLLEKWVQVLKSKGMVFIKNDMVDFADLYHKSLDHTDAGAYFDIWYKSLHNLPLSS